jgi:hypothetical protein
LPLSRPSAPPPPPPLSQSLANKRCLSHWNRSIITSLLTTTRSRLNRTLGSPWSSSSNSRSSRAPPLSRCRSPTRKKNHTTFCVTHHHPPKSTRL